jgi:hypothetical protein
MDNPLPQNYTAATRVALLAKTVRESQAGDLAQAIVQEWPDKYGKALAISRLREMIKQIEGVKWWNCFGFS